MKRLTFLAVSCIALLVPVVVLAGGPDAGFDGVVSGIESRYNAHATRIPFIAFVSFMARHATHDGVSNLHIAEFEHFSGPVDGDELNTLVTAKLGAGWERIIRETSHRGNCGSESPAPGSDRSVCEQTLIFTRPEGRRMGMFIIEIDSDDMNVVQISVDPDHLNETINRYDHHPDNSDHVSGDVSN